MLYLLHGLHLFINVFLSWWLCVASPPTFFTCSKWCFILKIKSWSVINLCCSFWTLGIYISWTSNWNILLQNLPLIILFVQRRSRKTFTDYTFKVLLSAPPSINHCIFLLNFVFFKYWKKKSDILFSICLFAYLTSYLKYKSFKSQTLFYFSFCPRV
jgi:hypothetical protein